MRNFIKPPFTKPHIDCPSPTLRRSHLQPDPVTMPPSRASTGSSSATKVPGLWQCLRQLWRPSSGMRPTELIFRSPMFVSRLIDAGRRESFMGRGTFLGRWQGYHRPASPKQLGAIPAERSPICSQENYGSIAAWRRSSLVNKSQANREYEAIKSPSAGARIE